MPNNQPALGEASGCRRGAIPLAHPPDRAPGRPWMEKGVRGGEAISAEFPDRTPIPTPLGRVEVIPSREGNSNLSPPSEVTDFVLEFISLLYSHPGKGMWPQWSLPARKLLKHFAETVCCRGLKHRLWATPLHSTHTPKPADFSASLF